MVCGRVLDIIAHVAPHFESDAARSLVDELMRLLQSFACPADLIHSTAAALSEVWVHTFAVEWMPY